jgi:hypothetical protein
MDWKNSVFVSGVLEAVGLKEASTFASGNCQYNTTTEAFLQTTFQEPNDIKLLEATTSKIK